MDYQVSCSDCPRRRPAKLVRQSAAELKRRPWRQRVSKAGSGATNRQRQGPATRDVDPPCRRPAGHHQVPEELGLEEGGEGARGGRRRWQGRREPRGGDDSQGGSKEGGEAGGAGEPPSRQRERSWGGGCSASMQGGGPTYI